MKYCFNSYSLDKSNFNGNLLVSCNGGLNHLRPVFCDMVLVTELLNLTILVPELDKTSFLSHPRSCVLSQTLRPLLHEYFRREEKVEHGGSCSGCSVDSRRRPASKECHRGWCIFGITCYRRCAVF